MQSNPRFPTEDEFMEWLRERDESSAQAVEKYLRTHGFPFAEINRSYWFRDGRTWGVPLPGWVVDYVDRTEKHLERRPGNVFFCRHHWHFAGTEANSSTTHGKYEVIRDGKNLDECCKCGKVDLEHLPGWYL